ncbi:MAG TPA: SRPBCC family protein [Gammaproteobacteria bacterium]|nr:SRPBCC family protein [Gammaproteobacteria bacterium]
MKPQQATKSGHKSTVTLPNDRDVVVVRNFNAPRALVFDAWTKPALVQRWMLGPPGWTMPVCEMDVRPGGKFNWRWRSEESGSEFGFSGEFREVERPSRIVHVERFEPGDVGGEMGEAVVTSVLTEKGGVTTMTMTIRYESKAVRDAALKTGMTDGMEMSYQKLDELLAAA